MDMGYRTYDPLIGRFLQVDPLNESFPNITPYCYSYNSPMTWSDASGLYPRYFETEDHIAKLASYYSTHYVSEVEALQNIFRVEQRTCRNAELLSKDETLKRIQHTITCYDDEVNAFGEQFGRGTEFREYFDFTDEQEAHRDRLALKGLEMMAGKSQDKIFDMLFTPLIGSRFAMSDDKLNTLKNTFADILSTDEGRNMVAELLGTGNQIGLFLIQPNERQLYSNYENYYALSGNFLGMQGLLIVDAFDSDGNTNYDSHTDFKILMPDVTEYQFGISHSASNINDKFIFPNNLIYIIGHEFGHMEHNILYDEDGLKNLNHYWNSWTDGDLNYKFKELYANKIAYNIWEQFSKRFK